MAEYTAGRADEELAASRLVAARHGVFTPVGRCAAPHYVLLRVPGPNRYILLASVSAQTTSILSDLLSRAGLVDPLVTVRTDVEAVATMHQPDREPPLAVFIDLPGLADAMRLIAWIISSPTTRLIPVFAITGPGAPDSAEVEAYKPTAIIPHPLSMEDISKCVELSPLLRGAKARSGTPPANSGRPPFSLMLAL